MRLTRPAIALLAALWLALCAAPAALAGAPESAALSPAEARKWLARIHAAAHTQNYQGILVFSSGGTLSSSRVAHFGESGHSYERIEALDGTAHVIYRHDDKVYTLWPNSRIVVIEDRDPRQASLRQVIEPRAEEHYALRLQGNDRVAGRDARVLLLDPRDELRFAQRLWIDDRTGLILRADVLGPDRRVLESSAFSEVEIGVKPRPEIVLQPLKRLKGYRQVRPPRRDTHLETEGWVLKSAVPGFILTSCSRRALDAAAAESAGQAVALQTVFSDGLTHVSVFVEPRDGARHRQAMATQLGAMNTLMQPFGEAWWVTVMGDVPAGTLSLFVQHLERRH